MTQMKKYVEPVYGISIVSEERVKIIGEQVEEIDGKKREQYVYHIIGYTPENGKPFVALKPNIILEN